MKNLSFSQENSIGIITFNRPQALNALNSDTFIELNELLDQIEIKLKLSALIFTGAGKAFVAGADIAEMQNMTPNQAAEFSNRGQRTFNRIEKLNMPVIAAVNGFALGGGLELALACDLIYASDKAKFSAPEVNLGLIPGFAGTQRLTQKVGVGMAKHLLYTADMVDAPEALRIGLAQKTFALENLMSESMAIAEKIGSKGPKAIKAVKQVVNLGLLQGFIAGEKNENLEFAKLFEDEGKEGMTAFLEKRKPQWT